MSQRTTPTGGRARRRILVVDRESRSRERVAEALEELGCELVVREALGEPSANEFGLAVVNYDALSDDERAALPASLRPGERAPLLMIATMRTLEDHARIFGTRAIANVLAAPDAGIPEDFLVTARKILGENVFGIEQYFGDCKLASFSLMRASDRRSLMRDAEDFLAARGISPRVAGLYCMVLDEFVTNAFYNAPVDADGVPRYAHLPRTADVELGPDQRVTVTFACDGHRLGLATQDPFGSITVGRILDYLARCFRREADQIDDRRGGAGLGLFYAFRGTRHFVVNLAPGKRTEMIGLIDLDTRGAAARKSFNAFVAEVP